MGAGSGARRLEWVASSKKDLKTFPEDVMDVMGHALWIAQQGGKHEDAKPLKGFAGTAVLEVVENYEGDTFRCVYTVKFERAVYVLHSFQKKSKKGSETPKADIDLVKARLRTAEAHYRENYNDEED